MITDRLSHDQREAARPFLDEHRSWGLGMAVPAIGSTAPLPVGFGWDGGSGTTWHSNPQSGVTGILFTQRQAITPAPPPVVEDFWTAINAATVG